MTKPRRARLRIYPYGRLHAAAGCSHVELRRRCKVGGGDMAVARREGLTLAQADRWAHRLGLFFYEVWPDADLLERRAIARDDARKQRARPGVREANRARRAAYYRENAEYERQRERRRYHQNRDAILERKRQQRRESAS